MEPHSLRFGRKEKGPDFDESSRFRISFALLICPQIDTLIDCILSDR